MAKTKKGVKSQRQLKIGENIKRAITEIFIRGDIMNIGTSFITIREVDMSPDAKNARVYLEIFGQDKAYAQKIINQLNLSAPRFRFELSSMIEMKFVPVIDFVIDESSEYSAKINQIILEGSNKEL